MAVGDWASRHDRYANPLHSRMPDGRWPPMTWHIEDAALNYSVIPQVRRSGTPSPALHRPVRHLRHWGMYCYTNAAYKPSGDYLVELDIGILEEALNDETWAGWIDFKTECGSP